MEDTLSGHGYYTGRTAWKHARYLPLLLLTGSRVTFLNVFLQMYLIYSALTEPTFPEVIELFSPHYHLTLHVAIAVCSLIAGYIWIYQYKKIFSQ